MTIKPIKEWKYIFLDTSIIIDYLKDAKIYSKPENASERQRIINVQKLFDDVLPKNENLVLYVSAITLAEFIKSKRPDNIISEILEIFYSYEVTIIDFTANIANALQKNLEEYLPLGQKYQFRAKMEEARKKAEPMHAQQWVADDLKIVATAHSRMQKGVLDVVLTSDIKTFIPFATKFELPCLYSKDIPFDIFDEIDADKSITTTY